MAHQGSRRSGGRARTMGTAYGSAKKSVARKPGAKRTMSSYKAKAKRNVARKPGAARKPARGGMARGRMSYK